MMGKGGEQESGRAGEQERALTHINTNKQKPGARI